MTNDTLQAEIDTLRARASRPDPQLLADAQALAQRHPSRIEPWQLLASLCGHPAEWQRRLLAMRGWFALDSANVTLALQLAVLLFSRDAADEAASVLDRALQHRHDDASLLFHRAYLHDIAQQSGAAEVLYRRVLAASPRDPGALANLGILLSRLGQHGEARRLLEMAVQQQVQPAVLAALSESCSQLGAVTDARQYADHATRLEPASAVAWLRAGKAAYATLDLAHAEACLLRATSLAGAAEAELAADAQSERGGIRSAAGDYVESRSLHRRAISLLPDEMSLRWRAAMTLPAPSMSDEESNQALADFDQELDQLSDELDRLKGDHLQRLYAAASRNLPFGLAYLPFDSTPQQRRYGELLSRIMHRVSPELATPVPWRALHHGGRIRIGFVAANLAQHTILRYFWNWLIGMDPRRFETHVWHAGTVADQQTAEIAARVDHFHDGNMEPLQLAGRIREAKIDVLVFLEIGMDARLSALAALRSAPVQCATYGHPVTTGLSTVDVFLSGAALERSDAADRYVERLLTLPGLATCPRVPPMPNRAVAVPRNGERPQIVCTQMLFKLQPAFDELAATVVAATDAELLLFSARPGEQELQQRVLDRVGDGLRRQGLDPFRHLRLLPRCAHADYLGIVANVDLVLDSPGFTGGATSLDALHVGAPVATIDGVALRARQTTAMAIMTGTPDLVGRDAADCAARAEALLADQAQREDLRERLVVAAPALFADDTPIAALNVALAELAIESADAS